MGRQILTEGQKHLSKHGPQDHQGQQSPQQDSASGGDKNTENSEHLLYCDEELPYSNNLELAVTSPANPNPFSNSSPSSSSSSSSSSNSSSSSSSSGGGGGSNSTTTSNNEVKGKDATSSSPLPDFPKKRKLPSEEEENMPDGTTQQEQGRKSSSSPTKTRKTEKLFHVMGVAEKEEDGGSEKGDALISSLMEGHFVKEAIECQRQRDQSRRLKPAYRRKHRAILGLWTASEGFDLRLDPKTILTAFKYVDRFFAIYPQTPTGVYQLVGVSALLIAIKLNGEDSEGILDTLNEISGNQYSNEAIITMETHILNALSWDLSCVTPCHFLPYFIQFAFSISSLTDTQISANLKALLYSSNSPTVIVSNVHDIRCKKVIENICDFLTAQCLENKDIEETYRPSVIATSAIVAARRILNIEDVMPTSLANVCRCGLEDIGHLVENFVRVFQEKRIQFRQRYCPDSNAQPSQPGH